jgi:hypothetical protein
VSIRASNSSLVIGLLAIVSIVTSFPMRYIPLDTKDRKHISPNWTKTQLRGIQCILHATHGVVGPRRPFFEKAFGKDAGEFKYIIEQPEELIFHRENMKPYEEHFATALSNV